MTAQQQHIIGRQVLEVRIQKRPGARTEEYHALLSRLQREKIQPVLSAVLDSLCPPGQTIRIPRLVVDVGPLNQHNSEEDWAVQLAKQLSEGIRPYLAQVYADETQQDSKISGITPENKAPFPVSRDSNNPEHQQPATQRRHGRSSTPETDRDADGAATGSETPKPDRQVPRAGTPAAAWEALVVFLLHGRLPWWAGSQPGRYFLEGVLDKLPDLPTTEGRARLQRVLQVDTARQRLIAQLQDDKLLQLIEGLQGSAPLAAFMQVWLATWKDWPTATAGAVPFSAPGRETRWQAIWQQLLFEWPVDKAAVRRWAQRVLWQLVHINVTAAEKWIELLVHRLSIGIHSETPAAIEWQAILREVHKMLSSANSTRAPRSVERIGAARASHEPGGANPAPHSEKTTVSPTPKADTSPDSDLLMPRAAATPRRGIAPSTSGLPPLPEAIYLDNAGLVVLAPFLPRLLENMGWVEQKVFVNPLAQQRAALFLQWLVDGEAVPAPEYLLPLNKLLCGLAADAVMEAQEPFSAEEQAAGEVFLQAVIGQAPVLRNMSPPGFRGTFLWRAGVLRPEEHQWLLQVERQDFDLVLDRFPWSFQLIKLPWMSQAIYTVW